MAHEEHDEAEVLKLKAVERHLERLRLAVGNIGGSGDLPVDAVAVTGVENVEGRLWQRPARLVLDLEGAGEMVGRALQGERRDRKSVV